MTGAFAASPETTAFSGMFEPLQKAVENFTEAVKGAFGPFEKMTDIASHFVSSFDPALVADLGRRFRDLNAVIGTGLQPIVAAAREIVSYISSALLPIMRELRPIISEITNAVKLVLKDGIDQTAKWLHDMMPVFRSIKDIIVGLIPVFKEIVAVSAAMTKALIAVGRELIDDLLGTQGKSVKEFMESLRNTIHHLIETMLEWSVRIMAMFGLTTGIEALKKALDNAGKPKAAHEDATGMAVLLNAAFKSIAESGRSMYAAMFQASAMGIGEQKESPEEKAMKKFNFDFNEAIKAGQTDGKDMMDFVRKAKEWLIKNEEKIEEFFSTDLPMIVAAAKRIGATANDVVTGADVGAAVGGTAGGMAGPGGAAAGRWIGRGWGAVAGLVD